MRFATTYLNSLDFQTWLNFSPNAQRRVLVLLFGGLGVGWGWDVFARRCFSVRNRPQPSAAARNRSQPFATVVSTTVAGTLWPCQWGVLQKWSRFYGGSKRRVASFRVARVALRMHFVAFQHVSSCVKSHSV